MGSTCTSKMDSVILLLLLIVSSGLFYTSVVQSRASDTKNDEIDEIGKVLHITIVNTYFILLIS